MMKGQKQNLGESNQKDREHDRKIEIVKERDREREGKGERERTNKNEVKLEFLFFKCGDSGGPGEWRYKIC
jgi:hypothetical protein